jgi:hypothetical protein
MGKKMVTKLYENEGGHSKYNTKIWPGFYAYGKALVQRLYKIQYENLARFLRVW